MNKLTTKDCDYFQVNYVLLSLAAVNAGRVTLVLTCKMKITVSLGLSSLFDVASTSTHKGCDLDR